MQDVLPFLGNGISSKFPLSVMLDICYCFLLFQFSFLNFGEAIVWQIFLGPLFSIDYVCVSVPAQLRKEKGQLKTEDWWFSQSSPIFPSSSFQRPCESVCLCVCVWWIANDSKIAIPFWKYLNPKTTWLLEKKKKKKRAWHWFCFCSDCPRVAWEELDWYLSSASQGDWVDFAHFSPACRWEDLLGAGLFWLEEHITSQMLLHKAC